MTTHDPTYLGALETGYDQGYDEALLAVNRQLRDKPMVDSILDAYVAFRDADLARRQHASDCALHSEPAGTARPCDCASNPGAKPEHPQVTEAQVDAALAAFHHAWVEASNPTNYDVTQREAMRAAVRAAGAPEMKPWPIADNTGDVNAALNVVAGAVVHAALALGISYMPLSTRYGIAGRVVDEIRSGR